MLGRDLSGLRYLQHLHGESGEQGLWLLLACFFGVPLGDVLHGVDVVVLLLLRHDAEVCHGHPDELLLHGGGAADLAALVAFGRVLLAEAATGLPSFPGVGVDWHLGNFLGMTLQINKRLNFVIGGNTNVLDIFWGFRNGVLITIGCVELNCFWFMFVLISHILFKS